MLHTRMRAFRATFAGGNYNVHNFGNSGKTMLKYGGPGDSSYWNQTTWPSAQAANADIYTYVLVFSV